MVATKIIAIGGGEIGRPGYPIETTLIDREIIRLSEKKTPRFLFIPTASSDSESYYGIVKKYFEGKLKCKVDVLYLINKKINKKEIKNKILSSDIIYVGGGNTLKMMNIWRRLGVDKMLAQAHKKGIILSGLSAGAICWFRYGCSDSRKFFVGKQKSTKVTSLGFVNALLCPHYDIEKHRQRDLKKMTKNIKMFSIALDNCCAMEIIDKKYRIIASKKSANAYRVYWKNGKYFKELVEKQKDFQSLENLTD
jgi:dipeptidase E